MLAPPSQACDGLSTRMCRPRAGSPRTARFEALGRLSPHIRAEGFAASGLGSGSARYPHERAPEADTRPVAVAAVISAVRRPRSPRLVTGCTDEQLARRASEGDEAAFEAIYDRYAPGLLAFCRQLLGDPQEAEDALQQSFARVYSALRAGRGPSCLKPWVYAIARNRCLTLLAARRVVIDLDAVRGAVPPTEDCYAEVQRRADVGELVDDLHRLPDDQRVALVLFELGGHSQSEIAEVLGVVPARVKALVFQAREGLARAREARAAVCRDVLEELAVLRGPAPRRGPLADHLARCAACSAFASEMGRQRRALAVVILPAVPPVALKAKVLGTALTGSGGGRRRAGRSRRRRSRHAGGGGRGHGGPRGRQRARRRERGRRGRGAGGQGRRREDPHRGGGGRECRRGRRRAEHAPAGSRRPELDRADRGRSPGLQADRSGRRAALRRAAVRGPGPGRP